MGIIRGVTVREASNKKRGAKNENKSPRIRCISSHEQNTETPEKSRDSGYGKSKESLINIESGAPLRYD